MSNHLNLKGAVLLIVLVELGLSATLAAGHMGQKSVSDHLNFGAAVLLLILVGLLLDGVLTALHMKLKLAHVVSVALVSVSLLVLVAFFNAFV